MSSDDNADDLAKQKARNDAIRRVRDRRNAGTDAADDKDASADAGAGATSPNYVEFIDRKMREGEKKG